MSTSTRRPLPPSIVLESDLLHPHGPKVRVRDVAGRDLGWLDRPLAEFLLEALAERVRAA